MAGRILFATGAGVSWETILPRVCREMEMTPVFWLWKPTGSRHDWLPEDCMVVDGMKAGTDPWDSTEYPLKKRLWSAAELEAFAPYEDLALFMMDRFSGTLEFPYRARRRRFMDMASFCLAALDEVKPDYAFFSESPHQAFDYVLYAACRVRGIPTGMFHETHIPGLAGWKQSPELPLKKFPPETYDLGKDTKPKWAEFRDYWIDKEVARIVGGEEPAPPYYMDQLRSQLRTGELTIGMIFRKVTSPTWWRGFWPTRHNRLVQDFHQWLWPGPGGDQERWKHVMPALGERRRRKRLKRQLRRTYRRLQTSQMPAAPYLLVALHFQPERTTAPDGGKSWDQVYLVELIRSHVPDDIPIVVREHPWQASKRWANVKGRQPHEYKRLARIPNTFLAPVEVPIQELWKNALRIITINGTIGWEASSVGKRVWVMGPAWYLDAPGVEAVQDSKDLAEAAARLDPADVAPQDWRDQTVAWMDQMRPSLFPGNTSKTGQPGFKGGESVLEEAFVHAITASMRDQLGLQRIPT